MIAICDRSPTFDGYWCCCRHNWAMGILLSRPNPGFAPTKPRHSRVAPLRVTLCTGALRLKCRDLRVRILEFTQKQSNEVSPPCCGSYRHLKFHAALTATSRVSPRADLRYSRSCKLSMMRVRGIRHVTWLGRFGYLFIAKESMISRRSR